MNCLDKQNGSWLDCKSVITPLIDNITFSETSDKYEIFVLKNNICYTTTIYKYYTIDQVPSNFIGFNFQDNLVHLQDFEENYKPYCRIDQFIYIKDAKYSPVREFQLIGRKFTVIPPTPPDELKQNVFDIKIDETIVGRDNQVEFTSGAYYIREQDKITDNDYLEVSIVDKDNVTGLFEYYNLIPGEDVLELVKFIKTHSIIGGRRILLDGGQSKIIPYGLYIRISYFSYGIEPFSFKCDFVLPK